MKRVYIARGTAEAHLVRAYLENAGIKAIVRGETLSAVFGGIPIDADSLPSVWVMDGVDYDRAQELIAESSRAADAEEPEPGDSFGSTDWECPQCGETIDHELLVCWNCGAVRDQAE